MDAREPSTLGEYLDILQISRESFFSWIDPLRDEFAWERVSSGVWRRRNELEPAEPADELNEASAEDYVFSTENRRLYYNVMSPPVPTGDDALDVPAPRPLAR